MSEGMTYFCDVCGVQKKESNHWFKGYVIRDGLLTAGAVHAERSNIGFMVVPWDTETFSLLFSQHKFPTKPDAHLCGEGHALEWASKVLSAKS